jgi:hypothetical protein
MSATAYDRTAAELTAAWGDEGFTHQAMVELVLQLAHNPRAIVVAREVSAELANELVAAMQARGIALAGPDVGVDA